MIQGQVGNPWLKVLSVQSGQCNATNQQFSDLAI